MRSLNDIPRGFPDGRVVKKKIHLLLQEMQEIGVLSVGRKVP